MARLWSETKRLIEKKKFSFKATSLKYIFLKSPPYSLIRSTNILPIQYFYSLQNLFLRSISLYSHFQLYDTLLIDIIYHQYIFFLVISCINTLFYQPLPIYHC